MTITTSQVDIRDLNGVTRWSTKVTGSAADRLWFEVPSEHAALVSERSDAAMIAMLMPAMRRGVNLHVGGVVTDELLRWVNEHAQAVIRAAVAQYEHIVVTADSLAAPSPPPTGVGMGFSAGVDSFAALRQCYLDPEQPSRLRLTHLLFNNVGSHGDAPEEAEERFRRRASRVRTVTDKIGLPLVTVDSNVDAHFAIHPPFTNVAFGNTHTVRNAAVAHLLGGGLGQWYYASSIPASGVQLLHPSPYIGRADPVLLPQLSTRSLVLSSANLAETRVEKIRRLADLALAQENLDVCIKENADRINCSSCFKCMRTQMALDMIGALGHFDRVFNADVYRGHVNSFATEVWESDVLIDRELIALARETGWRWPWTARPAAAMRRSRKKARRGVRQAVNLVRQRFP